MVDTAGDILGLNMAAVHDTCVVGVGNFQSSTLLIIGIYPSRYHENKFSLIRSTGKRKRARRDGTMQEISSCSGCWQEGGTGALLLCRYALTNLRCLVFFSSIAFFFSRFALRTGVFSSVFIFLFFYCFFLFSSPFFGSRASSLFLTHLVG